MNREEFITRTRIDLGTLEIWIQEEWIVQREPPEFTEADVARAALIHDLIHDMGVNEEGVGVILRLLDQVHGLRRLVSQLQANAAR